MPIRKIKAQSPDPYVGKIVGDTEFARLAHLNYVIDAINNGNGGGGGGVVQVNTFDDLPVTGEPDVLYIVRNFKDCPTCEYPGNASYYWNAQTNSYFAQGLRVSGNTSPNNFQYQEGVNRLNFENGFFISTSGNANSGYASVRLENPRLDRAYRALVTRKTFDWPGHGFLYNWYAVTDARNIANPNGGTGLIAPNEWRVPSQTDWNVLITFVGSSNSRDKLSSVLETSPIPYDSQYGWFNNLGTDNYNFNAVPSGTRVYDGNYYGVGGLTIFWTSVSLNSSAAIAFQFFYTMSNVLSASFDKKAGFSLRLIRQATAGELLLNDGDTSDTSSLDPYTGNNGTIYTTVKIGTQIWLAQNLRETQYNNSNSITNLSTVGGDATFPAWQNAGDTSSGAYTISMLNDYLDSPSFPYILSKYLPELNVSKLFSEIREDSIQASPYWIETVDGVNPVYQLQLASRKWRKTFINVKPTYDTITYSNASSSIEQRSLIVKSAETCADALEFFPVNLSTNTIEDLAGDGAVYLEILEYKGSSSTEIICPGEGGSGSSGGGGIGLSLLELQNQDFENLSQLLGLGVEQI